MGAGGKLRRKQMKMAKIAAAVAILLGLVAGVVFDQMTGLLVGVGGLVLVAMYVLFTDPPPPRKGGDPGAINFGG
jgi:drug/metabolite transporter (DMT)-like permease